MLHQNILFLILQLCKDKQVDNELLCCVFKKNLNFRFDSKGWYQSYRHFAFLAFNPFDPTTNARRAASRCSLGVTAVNADADWWDV